MSIPLSSFPAKPYYVFPEYGPLCRIRPVRVMMHAPRFDAVYRHPAGSDRVDEKRPALTNAVEPLPEIGRRCARFPLKLHNP
jgi:hypothetical protein